MAAVYGACGPPIIGALEAIKAAGKKPGEVIVVGFDAAPDELVAIKAGDEAGSVAQFPAKMGSLGIETAVAAARGRNRRGHCGHRHRDGDEGERRRVLLILDHD